MIKHCSGGGGRRCILPAFLLWSTSVAAVVIYFVLLEKSCSAWTPPSAARIRRCLSRRWTAARAPVARASSVSPSPSPLKEATSGSTLSILPPARKPRQEKRLSGTSRARRKGFIASSGVSGRSQNARATEIRRTALPKSIPRLSELLVMDAPDSSKHPCAVEPPTVKHPLAGRPRGCYNRTLANSHSLSGRPPSGRQPPSTEPDEQNREKLTKPWQAGYHTSLRTQQLIKRAAAYDHPKVSSPSSATRYRLSASKRSERVLQTFLSTPPERSNPANLVCALTSSAKVLSSTSGSGGVMTDRGLELFFRTLDILDRILSQNLAPMSVRQLCNAIWAIARHYERDDRVLPPARERALLSEEQVIGVAERWDLTSLVEGDAGVEKAAPERLDRLVDRVAARITKLLEQEGTTVKAGELCMACWAYGVLRPRQRPPGWKHGPQLASIRRQRTGEVEQESSMFTVKFERWSALTSSDEEDESERLVPLTDVDAFFDSVGRMLLGPSETYRRDGATLIQSCQWKELANLAWAYASHGRSCSSDAQQVLLGIAREAAARLSGVGQRSALKVLSRDISQIIWSLGILQSDNFRLADGLVNVVDALLIFSGLGGSSSDASSHRPFRGWSCPDIVQVVLSLAHARFDEPDLLRQLFQEASLRIEQCEPINAALEECTSRMTFHSWEVSILLWSQARLYLKEPRGRVFERFSRVATSFLSERASGKESLSEIGIGSQEQANIAWSLTVLEEYVDPSSVRLLDRIFHEAAETCKRDGIIHLEHAHQLWQALFLLEEECPEAVRSAPGWFYRYLQEKWKAEKSRVKVSSARHKALSQTLAAMGVSHKNEHDEDIDVAIVLKPNAAWVHESSPLDLTSAGVAEAKTTVSTSNSSESVRVAVEFDGPNHFTRQKSPPPSSLSQPAEKPETVRALGHTVLKYRLLKKQGWIVVRVPYYEFDRIPFWASMERQRYLQRLLKTHGNLQFSRADVSEYKPPVSNRRSRFD